MIENTNQEFPWDEAEKTEVIVLGEPQTEEDRDRVMEEVMRMTRPEVVIGGNPNMLKLKSDFLDTLSLKPDIHNGKPIMKVKEVADIPNACKLIIKRMGLMLYGENKIFVFQNDDGRYVIADDTKSLISTVRRNIVELAPSMQNNQVQSLARLVLDHAPEHKPKLSPDVIYYANGEYDTKTGIFTHDTNPSYNHRRIEWNYLDKSQYLNPSSKLYGAYQEFNDFLITISESNADIMKQILQMIGASLLPTRKFRKAFFMIGEGGNGKSSLINMINKVHGREKVSSIALENLSGQRASFNCYGLVDKTVNLIDDLSSISMKENGVLKTIISGDQLQAEIKNGKQFSFYNEATLIAAGNSMPNINDKGNSTAILDRMVFIPLNHKFKISATGIAKAERLLQDDVIAVIASAISEAVYMANKNGLTKSQTSEAAAEQFEIETDSVKYWISETDFIAEEIKANGHVEVSVAYINYKVFVEHAGSKPQGKINWGKSVGKNYPELERTRIRINGVLSYVYKPKTKEIKNVEL